MQVKINTVYEQIDLFRSQDLDRGIVEVDEKLAQIRANKYMDLEKEKVTLKRTYQGLMIEKESLTFSLSDLQNEIDSINKRGVKKMDRKVKKELIQRQQELFTRKEQLFEELENIESRIRTALQEYTTIKEKQLRLLPDPIRG